jgi:uncharacterized membrane protein YccC
MKLIRFIIITFFIIVGAMLSGFAMENKTVPFIVACAAWVFFIYRMSKK